MNYSPSQVKELIDRFQNGQCTPEELTLLRQWMTQLDISDANSTWTPGQLQAIKENMFRQLTTPAPVIPIRRKTTRRRYIAAAGWLLLIASSVLLWYTFQKAGVPKQYAPVLTAIINDQPLVKKITLPDGTIVYLNRQSRIEFNTQQYNHTQRFVKLSGEGFFDVAKDPSRPFVVATGQLRTRVLGTAFNIEAYRHESEIRVSLVNGKIALDDTGTARTTVLAPDQTFRYSTTSGNWEIIPVEAQKVTLWTQGWLVFNEVPLQEVLQRMQERYRLQFEYKAALLRNKRISACFNTGTWQMVLENILFVHGLHYRQADGKIIIEP